MDKNLRIAIAALMAPTAALAAGSIVFDNTLPGQPHGTTTTVPLVGGHYTINASNTGHLSGKNLFESFAAFNVATGEEADFTNSTNLSISNVISRVTGIGAPGGLQPTTINGSVVSTIAGANFWFINPAGVTIGNGATINVPAGLAIGTADYIQFADSSRLYALESSAPTPSVLSTASPAAFGFLATPAIGALTIDAGALGSTTGGSVTLVSGGPLTVQGTAISSGPAGGSLGLIGNITMQSLSSVTLTGATIDSTGGPTNFLNTAGLIDIEGLSVSINSSTVQAGANGGGAIVLRATGDAAATGPDLGSSVAQSGELRVSGSTVSADQTSHSGVGTLTLPPGVNYGDIVMSADDVIVNTSSVHSIATGQSGAGNITLTGNLGIWVSTSAIEDTEKNEASAGVISLRGGALGTFVVGSTLNAMNGNTQNVPSRGGIVISAAGGAVDLQNTGITTSNIMISEPESGFSFSSPANGISISGQTIGIHGGTLTSQTVNSANAGNITLTVTGSAANAIQIDNGAIISSDATNGVTGYAGSISPSNILSIPNAGPITLLAPSGGISISGGSSLLSSAGAEAGQAGTVSLTGTQISLTGASILTTVASTQPNGVQRSLTGNNLPVAVPWVPATIALMAPGAVALTGSTLNATTSGNVAAGNIQVSAGGALEITSPTGGARGGVSTSSTSLASTAGSAGKITLAGTALTIDSSDVAATIKGGNAGTLSADIALNTTGAVTVSGGATIKGDTSGGALGGNVLVQTTGDVALTGAGTTISANATGAGSGGTVTIASAGLSLTNGASIATTAAGSGNSGAIAVTLNPRPTPGVPPPLVLAGNSSIKTNSDASTGGDITVNAGDSPLTMKNSTIIATAGELGNGGNITINDAGRTILQGSGILAQADSGNGGAINIFLVNGAVFLQDANSLVSAQSSTGNNGTVTIDSPQTDLNSALAIPDVSVARAPELEANVCKHASNRSTFVREGRGGVATGPDSYLTANLDSDSTNTRAADAAAATMIPAPADQLRQVVALATDRGCR